MFVIPPLLLLLPTSWDDAIAPYLPDASGSAIFRVGHDSDILAPWTGFARLLRLGRRNARGRRGAAPPPRRLEAATRPSQARARTGLAPAGSRRPSTVATLAGMSTAGVPVGRGRARPAAIAVAVFVSGGVLLGVEIASSRVLAPVFGNSLYVWGAVIGVVLAGLAIGYAVGGAVADRAPRAGAARRRDPARLGRRAADSRCSTTACSTLVVRWDPGPRLDPGRRDDPALRRVERPARRGDPDRRAAARARGRRARAHGRAALLGLDVREHRRHVRDRVLARADVRHQPAARADGGGALRRRRDRRVRGAAVGARSAVAVVACGGRRRASFAVAPQPAAS